jgi:eukaryotic-like serine/threonine-protein kinase
MHDQPPPEYWTEIEEILAGVVDLAPADRAAALAARCAARPQLRAEVESLLAAHDRGGLLAPGGFAPAAEPDEATAGSIVGSWRLLERIGQGGMSDVHRAVRASGDFTHVVAVKLVHTLAHDRDLSRRFHAEREVLGALHHPHVVALIDGGVSAQGRPYLVMELVEGQPMTQFARERQLPLHERLQIFGQVCSAVQHAHQNGIVHRDLKPANILITADGHAKVLDFGVAKLLTPPGVTPAGSATGLLPAPLTPNYASPEQLRGLPVTTASDVYALGVLLYELLSGARPYEIAGQPLDAVLERVLSPDTRRPSAVADAGAVPLPYPRRRLRGDLDAIVRRAMALEPERRYASAAELADDLARVRHGQPVLAREPSAGYLIRRFAARHTAAVVVGGIAVVGILAALSLAIVQARVAERERARAEQRFAEGRTLANALILRVHETLVALPGAMPARRAILDEARRYLERLAEEAGADPALALDLARAYHQLGAIEGGPMTSNLGDRDAASASFRKAIGLLEPLASDGDATIALLVELSALHTVLGQTLAAQPGRHDEGAAAALQGVAVAERLFARHPDDDAAQHAFVAAHYGMVTLLFSPERERHLRAALDVQRARLARAPDDPDRLVIAALTEWTLAGHLEAHGRHEDAGSHHDAVRRLYGRYLAAGAGARLGEEARGTALNAIGFASYYLGDLEASMAAYRESIAVRQVLAQRDRANAVIWPTVAATRASLARVLEAAGRRDEALREVEAALAIFERAPPDVRFLTGVAEAHHRHGRLSLGAGRGSSACASLRRAVVVYEDAAREERIQPIDRERLEEARRLAAACPPPAP